MNPVEPSKGESAPRPAELESLRPIPGAHRSLRRELTLKDEFVLALLPTVVVLTVLGFIEALSQQRVLFASLASSAFLIYLDPQHGANSVRSIIVSHLAAALVGAGLEWGLGAGYKAAAAAMVFTIVIMISADVVHPPSVGTALSFAFRPSDLTVLSLFILCLAVVVILVGPQRLMLRVLASITARRA
jgi:CBS-domain-containing membrane protein